MRLLRLLMGCILMVLVLVSSPSCGKSSSNVAGLGVPAKTGVVGVTIDSAYASHGDEYTQPKEGNVFLVLDISVVNVSSEEIAVQSPQIGGKAVWFSLLDDSGNEYSEGMGGVPEGQKRFEGKSLSPNETLSGGISFDVPTEWESLTLQVHLGEMLKSEKIIGGISFSRADISNPEALEAPSDEAIKVAKTYTVAGKSNEYQVVAWVENESDLVAGSEKFTASLYGSDGKVLGSKTMEYTGALSRMFPSSGRWVISDVFTNITTQPTSAELKLGDVWWQDPPAEPPSFNVLQADFAPGQNPSYPEYEAKVVGKFSYSGETVKRVGLVVVLLGDNKEPVGTARAEVDNVSAGEHPFEAGFSYNVVYPTKPVASIEVSFITP